MKYCHQCGYSLTLGIEKFCPNCGIGVQQNEVLATGGEEDKNRTIEIRFKGDVLAAGINGTENIIGNNFILQESVLIINTGDSISKEAMEQFKNLVTSSMQIGSKISQSQSTTEDNIIKSEEQSFARQQITSVLHEVERIENKREHGSKK